MELYLPVCPCPWKGRQDARYKVKSLALKHTRLLGKLKFSPKTVASNLGASYLSSNSLTPSRFHWLEWKYVWGAGVLPSFLLSRKTKDRFGKRLWLLCCRKQTEPHTHTRTSPCGINSRLSRMLFFIGVTSGNTARGSKKVGQGSKPLCLCLSVFLSGLEGFFLPVPKRYGTPGTSESPVRLNEYPCLDLRLPSWIPGCGYVCGVRGGSPSLRIGKNVPIRPQRSPPLGEMGKGVDRLWLWMGVPPAAVPTCAFSSPATPPERASTCRP